jgi:hypothetical protein
MRLIFIVPETEFPGASVFKPSPLLNEFTFAVKGSTPTQSLAGGVYITRWLNNPSPVSCSI